MKTLLSAILTITTLASVAVPAYADDRGSASVRVELNAIVDRDARAARFEKKADAAKRTAERAGAVALGAVAVAAVSGAAAPLFLVGGAFAGLVAASTYFDYNRAAGEAESFRFIALQYQKSLARLYGKDVTEALVHDAENGVEFGSNVNLRDLTKTETSSQTANRMQSYHPASPSRAGVKR